MFCNAALYDGILFGNPHEEGQDVEKSLIDRKYIFWRYGAGGEKSGRSDSGRAEK